MNIDIAGNRYFDTPTLRERLSMTPASSIRHSRGSFSQGLLDRDIGTIVDLYHANGFPDAKVVSTKDDDYKGKPGDLSVRLEVMEGAQKFVNKLTLEGGTGRGRLPPALPPPIHGGPAVQRTQDCVGPRFHSELLLQQRVFRTRPSTGPRLPDPRPIKWILTSSSSQASGST